MINIKIKENMLFKIYLRKTWPFLIFHVYLQNQFTVHILLQQIAWNYPEFNLYDTENITRWVYWDLTKSIRNAKNYPKYRYWKSYNWNSKDLDSVDETCSYGPEFYNLFIEDSQCTITELYYFLLHKPKRKCFLLNGNMGLPMISPKTKFSKIKFPKKSTLCYLTFHHPFWNF